MFNTDLGLEVFGKPFGHLAGNPILAKRSLYKNIQGHQQKEQGEKEPF